MMNVATLPDGAEPKQVLVPVYVPSAAGVNEHNLKREDSSARLSSECIAFGDYLLEPTRRLLTRRGIRVPLGDRAFDILVALVERRGRVVTKQELFAAVWPETTVDESNLRVQIAALRKALRDKGRRSQIIAAVAGRGYVFIGEIAPLRSHQPEPATYVSRVDWSVLPLPLSRIIGRDKVIDAIGRELSGRHLITLAGPGGVGKTTLALATAQRFGRIYNDGVHFFNLAGLDNSMMVVGHLASQLRLQTAGAHALECVVNHFCDKNALLVLDNCEHVIDGASAVAEEVLKWAPWTHVLATSREPLRAMGEWIQRVESLALPPASNMLTAGSAKRSPAIELLAECAAAQDSDFRVTNDNAQQVFELCCKLDGLPLAIELAATRVAQFGLREVVDRLGDRLDLLTRGRRTAEARHQTLRAMINWSYEMLSESERAVWRRLSTFSNSFGIDAAENIGKAGITAPIDIVEIVGTLVAKSMLSADLHRSEVKYRMLESLRLYASEKLIEKGEVECVKIRHATSFPGTPR
jgi:predicted ATPase/DNA-binding winged helix-turn-helix (wHTH) protein